MTKKKSLVLIGISTFVMIVILGLVSYAYWTKNKVQTGQNKITPGCLDFAMYDEQDDIDLEDAVPISDQEGRELVPYKFTVKNTCTLTMKYNVNIEVLSDSDLSLGFVAAVLDDGKIKTISSLKSAEPTIPGATSKTIATAKLNPDGERTHEFRIWLDKNVSATDDAQNKTFKAKIVVVGDPTGLIAEPEMGAKCIRAKTLHTEICNQSSSYCGRTGSIGYGNTVTYGNQNPVDGVLNTGDAFDCDVDGTGYNHRFYYVSERYVSGVEGSEIWDNDVAVLIYYGNVVLNNSKKLVVQSDNSIGIAYELTSVNYLGPVEGVTYLPSTDMWTNLTINEARIIRNEKGTTTNIVSGVSYSILPFNGYENKAARLLTSQEISKGCGLTTRTMTDTNALDTDTCRFLLQNTSFTTNYGAYGYWLETPYADSRNSIKVVAGPTSNLSNYMTTNTYGISVRPAIEVDKSDIDLSVE